MASSPEGLVVDVVLPAHNDAATLPSVLGSLPMRDLRAAIVVDNGSDDQTAQVAADHNAVVIREPRLGYGAACRRALAHLAKLPRSPDVVVFMAADGSDSGTELARLLGPIDTDNAELVIGVRQGRGRGRSRNRVALGLISAIYRHRFEDLGPFRAIRYPALVALGMAASGAGWNVEMQVKAVKLGLNIVEVPVSSTASAGPGGVKDVIDSVNTTGRMLFHILRHSTAR
jgi:glycosyltransferase involved in cell wall biosynthesis